LLNMQNPMEATINGRAAGLRPVSILYCS
jgi:hypothetical protein